MVLAAIIPTADGAFWHGSAKLVPAQGAAGPSGRQSARRAAKGTLPSAAAVAAAEAAALAALDAARVMQAVLAPPPPPPEAAAKRAKGAERADKGAKRKREGEAAGEQPAAPPAEAKTGKEKKEHDKYCHFCQVRPAARARRSCSCSACFWPDLEGWSVPCAAGRATRDGYWRPHARVGGGAARRPYAGALALRAVWPARARPRPAARLKQAGRFQTAKQALLRVLAPRASGACFGCCRGDAERGFPRLSGCLLQPTDCDFVCGST